MYDSHNIAIAIKSQAAAKNIVIKKMLEDLGLGSNTMSAMYHGKSIASDSLAKIATYLGCSTDYLLGNTDDPTPAAQKEKPAPLSEDGLSAKEAALIHLFQQVPDENQQMVLDMIQAALKNLG